MSVYDQTYEQSSMHQRPGLSQSYDVGILYDSYKSSLPLKSGFKPAFKCRYAIKHMNSLPT